MTAERPPPARIGRDAEWVGPEGSREDVSSKGDRDVLLRTLHEVLCLQHDLGKVVGELGDHGARITSLEARPKEDSSHDWTEMLKAAGDQLSERVKDPGDKMSSDRARQIAEEAVKASKTKDKADAYDRQNKERRQLYAAVLAGLILLLAGLVAGHFEGRGTGVTSEPAGVRP